MGDLPPRRIRIRRERLKRFAWAGWLLLAAFIVAGSAGRWAPYRPGIWAPTLINPGDVARNVALYVPFGVLGMLALGRSSARGVLRVTGLAVIFSFANEAFQLYTADRVASLTDIVSAGVGTASGAGLVAWLVRPKYSDA
jgi:VanZ family protein